MAPIRRYLRLTPHTTLEVRIYLDNPSLASTWLLHPSPPASVAPSPVLPRIISAIRPLVLPKLREENERAKGRSGGGGKRAKGTKDTVTGEDFEVGIWLTEMEGAGAGCRHSVLRRDRVDVKAVKGANGVKRKESSLAGWLTGGEGEGTEDKPVEVDEGEDEAVVIREESSDEEQGVQRISLLDYPEVGEGDGERQKGKTRKRTGTIDAQEAPIDVSSDEGFSGSQEARRKRQKQDGLEDEGDQEGDEEQKPAKGLVDDKKKLHLHTQYDGYSIHGHILCLIVKRRGGSIGKGKHAAASGEQTGSKMLEEWVSTQAAQGAFTGDD